LKEFRLKTLKNNLNAPGTISRDCRGMTRRRLRSRYSIGTIATAPPGAGISRPAVNSTVKSPNGHALADRQIHRFIADIGELVFTCSVVSDEQFYVPDGHWRAVALRQLCLSNRRKMRRNRKPR
jgi:hypothetical protein